MSEKEIRFEKIFLVAAHSGCLSIEWLGMDFIPDSVFRFLSGNKSINSVSFCGNCLINEVKQKTRKHDQKFKEVKKLSFANNKFKYPPGFLKSTPNVVWLNLSKNQLESIPEISPLLELKNLQKLQLDVNSLKILPHGIQRLVHLQELDLSVNQLSYFEGSFTKLKSLRILNASRNSLITLFCPPEPEKLCYSNDYSTYTEILSNLTNVLKRPVYSSIRKEGSSKKKVSRKNSLKEFYSDYTKEKLEIGSHLNLYRNELIRQKQPIFSVNCFENNNDWVVYFINKLSGYYFVGNEYEKDLLLKSEQFDSTLDLYLFTPIPRQCDLFGNLKSLEEINLSYNYLKHIPNSLKNLVHLKKLDLSFNCIEQLGLTMCNLKELLYLKLSNNKLVQLPAAMNNLKKIRELYLSSNELEEIPETLCEINSLEVLDLASNKLEKLPLKLYSLPNLVRLNIVDNKLSKKYQQLGEWNIDPKKQTKEIKTNLEDLHLLEKLGSPISRNLESKLDCSLLLQDKAVTDVVTYSSDRLSVQNFSLYEVPQQIFNPHFLKCEQLLELNLSYNYIRSFDSKLLKCINLESLDMSFNQISNLFEDCKRIKYSKLKTLNLQRNRIRNLSQLQCPCLISLNIEGNKLDSVSHQNYVLEKLKVFNCSDNKICSFQKIDTLFTMSCPMIKLDISKQNEFFFQDDYLSKLSLTLTELNLSYLKISDIPEEIFRLTRLATLNLMKNNISKIPEEISKLEKLKFLNISHNNIYEVCHSLYKLQNLSSLKYANNPNIISPPVDLEVLECSLILRYCKVRYTRHQKLKSLLEENNFLLCEKNFSPKLDSIFVGGYGYLNLSDLRSFEDRANLMINGNFWKHTKKTLKSLVQDLVGQREKRLISVRQACVRKINSNLISVEKQNRKLIQEKKKPVISAAFFNHKVMRENVEYFAIDIATFFHFFKINSMKEHVHHSSEEEPYSVYRKLEKQLNIFNETEGSCENEFLCNERQIELTRELVEDAAKYCEFPSMNKPSYWNELATFKEKPNEAEILFKKRKLKEELISLCRTEVETLQAEYMKVNGTEGEDVLQKRLQVAKKNLEKHETLLENNCASPALLIRKLILSEEEDERREEEEEIQHESKLILKKKLLQWEGTESFRKKIQKKVRHERNNVEKKKLSFTLELNQANIDLKETKKELTALEKRVANLSVGKNHYTHGFSSIEDAEIELETMKQLYTKILSETSDLSNKINVLKEKQLKYTESRWKAEVRDSFSEKLCFCLEHFIRVKGRIHAIEHNLRRPWDGADGADFAQWCEKFDNNQKAFVFYNKGFDELVCCKHELSAFCFSEVEEVQKHLILHENVYNEDLN
eukprot:maker-scaffold_2-snap-gene-23.4-mRNA-1 protein AED:0.36 eAED:0.36 QI:0/0/0/0.33/1/1/3/0/1343